MKVGNLASLVVIVAAAGGLAIGLSGDKGTEEIKEENKDDPVSIDLPVHEYDIIPQAVKVGNRHVYVVGLERCVESSPGMCGQKIKDTAVGRVVEHESNSVADDVLCPVILDAREKMLGSMKVPDVNIFGESWQSSSNHIPEKIELSESGGKWMWYVILKGRDCVNVVGLPQYVGSSTEEFDRLSGSDRRRILRKIVACGDGGKFECIVPIDIGDKTGYFFKELAGREDLKFKNVNNGKVEKRYLEPEGGFSEASAVGTGG